jgi:hypothetical protein
MRSGGAKGADMGASKDRDGATLPVRDRFDKGFRRVPATGATPAGDC